MIRAEVVAAVVGAAAGRVSSDVLDDIVAAVMRVAESEAWVQRRVIVADEIR